MPRKNHEKLAGAFYKRKFRWLKMCIYCGETATCEDHVFPLSRAINLECWRPSVKEFLKQGLNLVPACDECNRLASDKPFRYIREKRRYIQAKLKKKYKVTKQVIWDDEEILELKGNLRRYVIRNQNNRHFIDRRITFLYTARIDAKIRDRHFNG